MKISRFISEKIDHDTNIIWFENSNKYILVNNIINNLILNKLDPLKHMLENQTIIMLEKEKNNSIKSEINDLINECNKVNNTLNKEKQIIKDFIADDFTKIRFNNKICKIEYGNKNLKNIIEPKFYHLLTNDREEIIFRVFDMKKKLYLYKEDQFIGSWDADEMHEFQGKVSMELTSFFHNKQESEWTCVFHGSTLCKKQKSIMMTGDSGAGKSSLSTILMSNDFSLIADDFSPMSIDRNHYNFPSAISIKEGFYKSANKLYKKLENQQEYFVSKLKGNVKYLPPDYKNKMILKSVCNIVFNVKFGVDLSNEIKEVNKGDALNKILPDCWISRNIKHANNFVKWVKQTRFYDLTYNNDEEVIKMINKII